MSWIIKTSVLPRVIPLTNCSSKLFGIEPVFWPNCSKIKSSRSYTISISTRAFDSKGYSLTTISSNKRNLINNGFNCCSYNHKQFSTCSLSANSFYTYGYEENRYAENFLRASEVYKTTVFRPYKEANSSNNGFNSSKKFHPTVERFIKIGLNPDHTKYTVTSKENREAVEDVLSNLKVLKDDEILQVLYHLRFFEPCPSAKDPGYFRIWSAIDKECVSRMSTWSFDYCFVVADLWYGVYLSRLSSFHWNLVKKCFRKCDRLTKEQFIRFMFSLNLTRRVPEAISTYDVEYYLSQIGDKLNSQEVAIVAMAFFKTETYIRDYKVLEKLLDVFLKDAGTVDSISVAAVAKLARFCSTKQSKDCILRFQEAFLPEIDRLSIPACTHLALIGTKSQVPHLELINSVVKKIESHVKEARLKELERISLAMTMFNVDCDKLCYLIVDELRSPERADEIRSYGRSLPAILHYLSLREIFPKDLINIALAQGFRNSYYGKKWENYQRELLCLDYTVELEISDYTGNRLDFKTRDKLTKMNILRLAPPSRERVSEYQKATREVVNSMEVSIGGPEYVYPCNILPQHNTIGIVYCVDKNGHFSKVPETYRQRKSYEIKHIPKNDDSQYNVIFLCSRNIELAGLGDLSGQGHYQVRQLRKMGYQVQVAYMSDYCDENARDDLMNRILSGAKKSNKTTQEGVNPSCAVISI